jgi:DNA invertase Pin-like site-specific DNA recombinase
MLLKRGVRVIASSGDDPTDVSDPSRIMMRQIAGSFAEYEKNRLVRKLREARERSGNLGGRKQYAEARPETVALAKQLHAQGLSYGRYRQN